MAYLISQWPDTVQRKEIESLPMDAETAVMVMLRQMGVQGPMPTGYGVKRLGRHLRGLFQANLKINREQIRVLFSVYGKEIVLFHVFKKTSPQIEQRGYRLALKRKAEAEDIMRSGHSGFTTVH